MQALNVAASNAAMEGISILTAPVRWTYKIIRGAIVNTLQLAAILLLWCVGGMWVLYRFVLMLCGTPVDWSGMGRASFDMTLAYLGAWGLIIVYPFIGLFSIGGAWVMYRKHNRQLRFGEGAAASIVGFVYGGFWSLVAIALYIPAFGDLGGDWKMGSIMTLLTVTTFAPVAFSLYRQRRGGRVIAAMAAYIVIELITFSTQVQTHMSPYWDKIAR